MIVTYNRKAKLVECLAHLERQTVRPDAVLVVDNASTDGTVELVRSRYSGVQVLALEENRGGAGGFAAGMRHAYAAGFTHLWLFDDDAFAQPDCLERLAAHARSADVVVPVQVDQVGRRYGVYAWHGQVGDVDTIREEVFPVDVFTFVGPLISREVIRKLGFPREDFFICADDLEYALRIHHAGMRTLCVGSAVFRHDYGGATVTVRRFGRSSHRRTDPAWKNYYNTRNDILIARAMPPAARRRFGKFLVYKHARSSLGEAMFDADFLAKWKYTARGVIDGVLNRTGMRVRPNVIK